MITPRPPFFRALKLVAFGTVTALMGETAYWEGEGGRIELAGAGLFKEPTEAEIITGAVTRAQGAEFNSLKPVFRYVVGQFPGLFEFVRDGGDAVLRLSDGRRFLIGDFEAKYDGETFVALLSPITR